MADSAAPAAAAAAAAAAAPEQPADAADGGFQHGFGRRGFRGGRGRGGRRFRDGEGGGDGERRGRGGRRGRRGRSDEKAEWVPVTKLGRLVKERRITSLEQIYLFSLPIKEHQIVDYFLTDKIKDEVMKITPVQKQTQAGQRTRFKACIIVGDMNGHVGVGEKVAKEVATAIRGAIIDAKIHLIPVRRGWWGQVFGAPHTVPCKVTGKCGSVRVHLIPAPKGTGLVAAPVSKKVLSFAGVKDVFTGSQGCTRTMFNFVKATFDALKQTTAYLTPDHWQATHFQMSPYQEFTDWLKETKKEHVVAKQERGH